MSIGRRNSSKGSPKTVEPNTNSQDIIFYIVLILLTLSDSRFQVVQLEMKNRQLREENGKLARTLNEYQIANITLEIKLEEEKRTITAIL